MVPTGTLNRTRGRGGGVAVHERVWENAESRRPQAVPEWKSMGTYALLGAIGAVFLVQAVLLTTRPALHDGLFVIDTDWLVRPWSLVTSTLAHGGLSHLFINGLVLYFFGPIAERILGMKRFLVLFFVTGAIAGILQVHLSAVYYAYLNDLSITQALMPWTDAPGDGALGASGALLFVFGFLMVLMPNQTILLFFIIPVPFWLAGILFALADIAGAINPDSGVGNFAHLTGMAIGLVYGRRFKAHMGRRGMRLVY